MSWPGDRIELPVAQRDELLSLPRASGAENHAPALVPAGKEDERRYEPNYAGGEGPPDVPAEWLPVVQYEPAEDRRRNRDPREDRREREVARRDAAPLPPERGQQGHEDEQVRARQQQQRQSVEVEGLVLGCHWALLMIGRAPTGGRKIGLRRAGLANLLRAGWKDGPLGLLACLCGPDTFHVLGDASRVALYWP